VQSTATQASREATQDRALRIRSIDIARGAAMVLMAIDHVRVFSGVPAGGPTADIFLTRWVTNFCAPAFVFLAGVSIFLHGQKLQDLSAQTRWLVSRGAWLVLLELTFLRLAWTFNIDFKHYMLAGVIWMLGWCMILMGLLVRLPVLVNAVFGVAIIVSHNIIPLVIGGSAQSILNGPLGWLWRVLYFGGGIAVRVVAEPNFFVLYSIIPWIGVMSAGYAFGVILRMPPERRDRICYMIGVGAIVVFLVFRYFNIYGDRPWVLDPRIPGWISFLSTSKYPASFLFLLMTLGPTIAALPLLERAQGRLAQWLTIFGRTPLFYYLLHIPLIHAVAVGISLVRSPSATGWLFTNHPVRPDDVPEGYTWNLGLLYLVTAMVVIALYFVCRRFAEFKSRRKDAWLSYL
jgi:uncharacterized membrane protein